MSLELHDVGRVRVTALAHCALAAHKRIYGTEYSEQIRKIVEEWAVKQVHGATVLSSCLKAKGLTVEDAGISGSAAAEPLNWDHE